MLSLFQEPFTKPDFGATVNLDWEGFGGNVPKLFLPFNDPPGSQHVYDPINQIVGTLNGGVTWQGNYVSLDGSSGYISTASLPSYSVGEYSFTWNLWVRLRAAGNYPMAITQGSNTILWLGTASNKIPMFSAASGSVNAPAALNLNQWYMITLLADQYSGQGIKICMNGVVPTSWSTGYANINVSSPQFGRRNDGFYAAVDIAQVNYFFGPASAGLLNNSQIAALYADPYGWAAPTLGEQAAWMGSKPASRAAQFIGGDVGYMIAA